MCRPSDLLPGGGRVVVEELRWRLEELVMCQKPA